MCLWTYLFFWSRRRHTTLNKNNKALFIFGFIFYFIRDLATTYLALSNGMPESGLVRILTRYDFSIMVLIKVVFYTALYFFIEYFGKGRQLSLRRYSWAYCRDGDDDYLVKRSDPLGVFELIGTVR
jgi:hypothetical protein